MRKLNAPLLLVVMTLLICLPLQVNAKDQMNVNGSYIAMDEDYYYYGLIDTGIVRVDKVSYQSEVLMLGNICYLNLLEDDIYFTYNYKYGLYKIDKDGNNLEKITNAHVINFKVVNDQVFYINGEDYRLHRIVNGEDEVFVDFFLFNLYPYQYILLTDGEKIFINDAIEGLFSIDIETREVDIVTGTIINSMSTYFQDNLLYSLDLEGEYSQIWVENLETGDKEVLLEGDITYFSIYGDSLYYIIYDYGNDITQFYDYNLLANEQYLIADFPGYYPSNTVDYFKDSVFLEKNYIMTIDDDAKIIEIIEPDMGHADKTASTKMLEAKKIYEKAYEKLVNKSRISLETLINYTYINEQEYTFTQEISTNIDTSREKILESQKYILKNGNKEETTHRYYYADEYFLFKSFDGESYRSEDIYETFEESLQESDAFYELDILNDAESLVMEETDDHFIISTYKIAVINELNYLYDLELYYDFFDYSLSVWINKKTNEIEKLQLSYDFDGEIIDIHTHRQIGEMVMVKEFDYTPTTLKTPSFISKNDYTFRKSLELISTDYSSDEELIAAFEAFERKYDNITPEIYYFMYYLIYDYDQAKAYLETYLDKVPNDLDAHLDYLYYTSYWDGIDQKSVDKVVEDWIYRNEIYELILVYNDLNDEERKEVLDEWEKEYPLDSDMQIMTMQYLLDTNAPLDDFKDVLDNALESDNIGEMLWMYARGCLINGEYELGIEYYDLASKWLDDYSLYIEYFNVLNRGLMVEEALEVASQFLDEGYYEDYIHDYALDVVQNNLTVDGQLIKYLVQQGYLYEDSSKQIEDEIFSKDDLTEEEIQKAYDQLFLEDDPFSYIVFMDEEYEEQALNVTYEERDDNKVYIQFDEFSTDIGSEVKEYLDAVNQPEEKTLVLDLRGNLGGSVDEAGIILDTLLGDCVSTTLIDRDGYYIPIYSDEYLVPFKEIFILVDGNTASASEMVTLGLKEHLNNVTIVGQKTYGKGVAQTIYTNYEDNYVLALVSHYWNVKQLNINDIGIEPDIVVEGESLEDYMNAIQ